MEKEVILKQFKGLLYVPPLEVRKGYITITNKRILFQPTLAEEMIIRAPVHDYMLWQVKVHPSLEGKNKRRISFDYYYLLKNKTKTLHLGVPAQQDPQEILDLLLKLTSETKDKKPIIENEDKKPTSENKVAVEIKSSKRTKPKKRKKVKSKKRK